MAHAELRAAAKFITTREPFTHHAMTPPTEDDFRKMLCLIAGFPLEWSDEQIHAEVMKLIDERAYGSEPMWSNSARPFRLRLHALEANTAALGEKLEALHANSPEGRAEDAIRRQLGISQSEWDRLGAR